MENHLSLIHKPNPPLSPLKSPLLRRRFAPLENNIRYPTDLVNPKSQLVIKDGLFRIAIDVHDYLPNEVKLKSIGHSIVVDMKHDEKDDEFGTIARSCRREFNLPPEMDMENITSWTSNGVLYIKVPAKQTEKIERLVDIKHEATSA